MMPRPRKQSDASRDVFYALADPNRRHALELLATGEKCVQDLAQHFPMSLAAVSQHLQVLRSAGLVQRREAGRRRLYAIDLSGIASIHRWLDDLAGFWGGALERLERHLDDDTR